MTEPKSLRTLYFSPNAKLISYYLPRRRFSADVVSPLSQVLAEINDKQHENTGEEENGEMSTEDFAQLSREDQLKVQCNVQALTVTDSSSFLKSISKVSV